jgi:predicted metal-binding membrane protein
MGRMHGQTWTDAAAFLRMWVAMTAVMMLPAATPALWHYRRTVARAGGRRPTAQTALAAASYLAVWAAVGTAVFPLGAVLSGALTTAPALARAVPAIVGAAVLAAGACQRTAWKARQLADCRVPHDARAAWRHGAWFARRCVPACANLMAIPLVVDVMNARLMAVVGTLIALERLVPAGDRVARATGVGIVAAGAVLIVRAVALG